MNIVGKSAEEAFHKVLYALEEHGTHSAPRGHEIVEIINMCVEITNPRDRIISCPERKIAMHYAYGELAWYLSGRNDLDTMKFYSKFIVSGSDDGETLNSAYGYRIFGKKTGEFHKRIEFDQWKRAVELLKIDINSRQSIIHLHTPNEYATKDDVCTLTLQFLVRDGKLNMITTMRSNDIVLGFTYDVFAFTFLQEMMANELGVEVGTYYHNVGSMHVYINGYYGENANDLITDGHTMIDLGPMEPIDFTYDSPEIRKFVKSEECNRKNVINHKKMNDPDANAFLIQAMLFSILMTTDQFILRYKAAFAMKAILVLDKPSQNVLIDIIHEMNENVADLLFLVSKYEKAGKKIIIEGADGAGKTAYIKDMLKDEKFADYHVRHYAEPTENFNYLDNYLLNLIAPQNEIFDRFFFSEMVYSSACRGDECKLNDDDLRILIDALGGMKENVRIVFVIALDEKQEDILLNRLKPEDHWLADKMLTINECYKQIAASLKQQDIEVEIVSVK